MGVTISGEHSLPSFSTERASLEKIVWSEIQKGSWLDEITMERRKQKVLVEVGTQKSMWSRLTQSLLDTSSCGGEFWYRCIFWKAGPLLTTENKQICEWGSTVDENQKHIEEAQKLLFTNRVGVGGTISLCGRRVGILSGYRQGLMKECVVDQSYLRSNECLTERR